MVGSRSQIGDRVLVVGSGGAGKTTVARALAVRTGLPLIHLDAHFWRPNWEPTPAEAWRAKVRDLVATPHWVIDGNYSATLDLRLPVADTIVFLDLPRRVTLPSVLARQVRWYGRVRPEMARGCRNASAANSRGGCGGSRARDDNDSSTRLPRPAPRIASSGSPAGARSTRGSQRSDETSPAV